MSVKYYVKKKPRGLVGGVIKDTFILPRVESESQVESLNYIVSNVNVNNINTNNVKRYNVNKVREIAYKLSDKLNDPNSFKYFCKVANKLPESVIWSNYEQSISGRNPKAYFTFLCNLEMEKLS